MTLKKKKRLLIELTTAFVVANGVFAFTRFQRSGALSVLLCIATVGARAEEVPWQQTIRAELVQAKKLGLCCPYRVSSSRVHVAITAAMAQCMVSTPRKDVSTFLEMLTADITLEPRLRSYAGACLRGLRFSEPSRPEMRAYPDGSGPWIAELSIPLVAIMPKHSPEPTPGAVH